MGPFSAEIAEHTASGATVRLRGELDLASAGQLREVLSAIGPEPPRLVLDLSRLTFLDSSGLNLLIRTHLRYRDEGRELVLVGANGMVDTVLGLTGLDRFVDRAL